MLPNSRAPRGALQAPPGPLTDYPVTVRVEDIDHMGHVNNAVYLQWVQSAVVRHWERIADAEAVARHLWVALKHEITYRSPAFLTDTIVATTGIERAAGAKAQFQTLIRRGDHLLAEVNSLWCCIDHQSHRPVRLPKPTLARFVASA
ncbi:acyl-CoA thioesterase [Caulobacter soli]|uniref:acyl-CoA thioesterase n=1 Tax=Caulobacter soli TaxID=2708539 RepID=UPI0013EC2CEE|nr:thioesterase family protein [Caulobacter soli]